MKYISFTPYKGWKVVECKSWNDMWGDKIYLDKEVLLRMIAALENQKVEEDV